MQLLEKAISVLKGVSNKHGGLTDKQLAKELGVSMKELKQILLEGARNYVTDPSRSISAHVDQDSSLTITQAFKSHCAISSHNVTYLQNISRLSHRSREDCNDHASAIRG